MGWLIYDFADEDGASVIGEWIRNEKIGTADVAALKQKISLLKQYGPDLPSGLLAGPIYKSIYKLRVNTQERAMRPLLCKGPIDKDQEFTLLLGACEINSKLPNGAVEEADGNRSILIA